MNPQFKLSDQMKLVATIDPQTVANTPAYSDAVDMSKYSRIIAVCLLGNMAAEAIDFSLEQDNASNFPSPAALVAATQLAAHASNNDNKQIILEASTDDLAAGETHLRAKLVTGNSTGGPSSALIFGVPRFSNESNLASVAEVKSPA